MEQTGVGDKLHRDSWEDRDHGDIRFGEVLKSLSALMNESERSKIVAILEVGCGVGAETRAIKELYPDAEVLAVDIDNKASEAAQQNWVEFRQIDMAKAGVDEIAELIGGKNLVIAMRTPGEVATNLMNRLRELEFQGTAIFSFLEPTDKRGRIVFEEMLKAGEEAYEASILPLPDTLSSPRIKAQEKAYVISFGGMNER